MSSPARPRTTKGNVPFESLDENQFDQYLREISSIHFQSANAGTFTPSDPLVIKYNDSGLVDSTDSSLSSSYQITDNSSQPTDNQAPVQIDVSFPEEKFMDKSTPDKKKCETTLKQGETAVHIGRNKKPSDLGLEDLSGTTAAKARLMNPLERQQVLVKRKLRNRQAAARSRNRLVLSLSQATHELKSCCLLYNHVFEKYRTMMIENQVLEQAVARVNR